MVELGMSGLFGLLSLMLGLCKTNSYPSFSYQEK